MISRTRGETRHELSDRRMPCPVDQVVGDSIPDLLEGQLAPLDPAIEPDDVMAKARSDGLRGDLAGRHRAERRVELRSRIARGELAQIATDGLRGACRMRAGQFGEPLGRVAQSGRHRLRLSARSSVCGTVARARRDQDVRGLVEIGGTEALQVVLVVAPASGLVGG